MISAGPLHHVTDPDDPRLDLYRDLNDPDRRRQLEGEQSVFVAEGKLAVERLLTSGYVMRSLLVDDRLVTTSGALVSATRARGAPVLVASRAVVAGTVGFAFHRGVVAIGSRPLPVGIGHLLTAVAPVLRAGRPRVGPRLVAVLEGLNDHENIGALFRNASAFGVTAVLLDPTCADPLNRRSIRVSVGHVLHVPFTRLVPWPSGLDQVRAAGFVVAALTPRSSGDSRVPHVDLGELQSRLSDDALGVALLLGAEGPGLTRAALTASDVTVSIPMASGVDSLNVATAAALAFYTLADPGVGAG